jgi:hypothetical protein
MVLKELLDTCPSLDGHPLTLMEPNVSTVATGGYQIVIGGTLDEETMKQVQSIDAQHQLALQIGRL